MDPQLIGQFYNTSHLQGVSKGGDRDPGVGVDRGGKGRGGLGVVRVVCHFRCSTSRVRA